MIKDKDNQLVENNFHCGVPGDIGVDEIPKNMDDEIEKGLVGKIKY